MQIKIELKSGLNRYDFTDKHVLSIAIEVSNTVKDIQNSVRNINILRLYYQRE